MGIDGPWKGTSISKSGNKKGSPSAPTLESRRSFVKRENLSTEALPFLPLGSELCDFLTAKRERLMWRVVKLENVTAELRITDKYQSLKTHVRKRIYYSIM